MEHFKQMQQSSVFQTWQITPLEGQINIDLPFTCSFMIPLPVWTYVVFTLINVIVCMYTPQKFITKVHITNYEHYRHKIEFPILRAAVFSMSIV